MAHILGMIEIEKVWHAYTNKSAKHGNGILDARPICGRAPLNAVDKESWQIGADNPDAADDQYLVGIMEDKRKAGVEPVCAACFRQLLDKVVKHV